MKAKEGERAEFNNSMKRQTISIKMFVQQLECRKKLCVCVCVLEQKDNNRSESRQRKKEREGGSSDRSENICLWAVGEAASDVVAAVVIITFIAVHYYYYWRSSTFLFSSGTGFGRDIAKY